MTSSGIMQGGPNNTRNILPGVFYHHMHVNVWSFLPAALQGPQHASSSWHSLSSLTGETGKMQWVWKRKLLDLYTTNVNHSDKLHWELRWLKHTGFLAAEAGQLLREHTRLARTQLQAFSTRWPTAPWLASSKLVQMGLCWFQSSAAQSHPQFKSSIS